MTVELRVGFVTDIDELMRQAARARMAVRQEAFAELYAAIRAIATAAVRTVAELLALARSFPTTVS